MNYERANKWATRCLVGLIGVLLAVAVASVLAGCQPPCDDCTRPERHGPRPHTVQLNERHNARSVQVCAGDELYVTLPCSGGTCYTPDGVTVPVLVREPGGSGVFRYRAACPGECVLSFHNGTSVVKYVVRVRP